VDLIRGRVYLANLQEGDEEPKYWLVVSNNQRNRAMRHSLAVRITSTRKYENLPSVVELPAGEPLSGFVRCDTLTWLYDDEPVKDVCALSRPALRLVEEGLKATLGISP
jgi:mRNA-degrading endonuclease toxin of MazEF toxin-antitoxin module